MKKLSQLDSSGAMMRSLPCARTLTCLTPSGKRSSAGRRTACVRLLVKMELIAMIVRPIACIWRKYMASNNLPQCVSGNESGTSIQLIEIVDVPEVSTVPLSLMSRSFLNEKLP